MDGRVIQKLAFKSHGNDILGGLFWLILEITFELL
jgi:hypothetical protein